MKRLLYAAIAWLMLAAPALAQNTTCPTAAVGTSDNRCASTAFVQNQLAVGVPIAVGVTTVTGGTPGRVIYDNSGVVGEYTQTQLTAQINGVTALLPGLVPAFPNNSTTVYLGTGLYGQVPNTALVNPSLTITATSPLTGGGSVALGTSTSIGCQLASGTQAGCLSSADWTTFNGKQAAGSYITALTGDGTASGPGSVALTLASVNAGSGSVGSSTAIPVLTTNAKGLVTAQSTAAVVAPAGTLSGTTLNSTVVSSSLTSVGTLGATTFGSTITAGSLSTVGTIGGSLCATSAGLFLYESGVNCFAASAASITVGTTTVANGTANGIFYQSGASPTGVISQLGLGTTTTLLHGNAAGTAAFGSLVYADIAAGALATSANLEAGTASTLLPTSIIYDAQRTITFNATQTLDFSAFLNGVITLTANITSLTCSNMKASQSGEIDFVQDGTGSRTMVAGWCSQFRWQNGSRGVLSTAPSTTDSLFYQCITTAICYVSLGKAQAN